MTLKCVPSTVISRPPLWKDFNGLMLLMLGFGLKLNVSASWRLAWRSNSTVTVSVATSPCTRFVLQIRISSVDFSLQYKKILTKFFFNVNEMSVFYIFSKFKMHLPVNVTWIQSFWSEPNFNICSSI